MATTALKTTALKTTAAMNLFARRSAHCSSALTPLATSQRTVVRVRAPFDAFAVKSWAIRSGACAQRFSTSSAPSPPSSDKSTSTTDDMKTSELAQSTSSLPFLDRVVTQLNGSIKKYPAETLAVLFASDIGSIGAMYGVLTLTGIEFSPEFALAFAVSRPFRRFRLPLDLAAAAAVSKVFPAFSRVRLSDLTGALPNRPVPEVGASSSTPAFVTKAMDMAKDVVDSYGAAYMMGSRLAGVGVVCGLYVIIQQGVDVMPLLAKIGVEDVGTALGAYAAAVVFSSAFYPVTLGVTGYVVPFVAKARRVVSP